AKQELESAAEPAAPGSLVVAGAPFHDVQEVPAPAVSLAPQEVPEPGDVHPHDAALARARVNVDSAMDVGGFLNEVEYGPLAEPEGGAHGADEAEDFRPAEEGVEADEPAHGRAGNPGEIALRKRAEVVVDDRFEGIDDEIQVEVALAATARIDEGAVLVESGVAGVGDGDDDGLDAVAARLIQNPV